MDFINWDVLCHNIAKFRKLRRWTQKDLADKLSVHPTMITRWEKGQIHPKEAQVKLIAQALQITEEDLLSAVASKPTARKGFSRQTLDPELSQLLEQVATLDQVDREALKAVINAMLIKNRVRDAVGAVA